MKKLGLFIGIALGALFISISTGCNTTTYEHLYMQMYEGNDNKSGEAYVRTDETFQIVIRQSVDGYWFGSYTTKQDYTYIHATLSDQAGNLLHFPNRSSFTLEIPKYGYKIVTSEPKGRSGTLYSLRKIMI